MIRYEEGDLLDDNLNKTHNVIVHGCNCFHTMGSGVAKTIADKYPEALEADKELTKKGDRSKLGTISAALVDEDNNILVVNAYTQYEYGTDKQHLDYKALESCMKEIKTTFSKDKYSIRMPKIGAGLAGGDWVKIEKIINNVFNDREVLVRVL